MHVFSDGCVCVCVQTARFALQTINLYCSQLGVLIYLLHTAATSNIPCGGVLYLLSTAVHASSYMHHPCMFPHHM